MSSPFGSDLPEMGLLRTSCGRALIKLGDGPRWLPPILSALAPSLVPSGPEAELIDLLLRLPEEVLPQLMAQAAAFPVDWSLIETGLSAPLGRPGKVIALGRTFPAHVRELGNIAAPEPLIFSKLPENLRGSGHSIALPKGHEAERFDNEIELVVALGKDLKAATPAAAAAAIYGYSIANDFTWRSEQERAKAAGQPWFLAKNLPGGLPMGPALVPKFLLPEPQSCRLSCWVDEVLVQETDYRGMSQSPAELLAWLSHRQALYAGDLVLLGTPAGVSSVGVGSEIVARVEGLGTLRIHCHGDES